MLLLALPLFLGAPPAAAQLGDYPDLRPSCDLDGDGVRDFLGRLHALLSTDDEFIARSGANSSVLWASDHGPTITLDQLWRLQQLLPTWGTLVYYGQRGLPYPYGERITTFPPPAPPTWSPTPDLNANGACDFVAYNLTMLGSSAYNTARDFRGELQAFDGKTGLPLWDAGVPLQATVSHVRLQNNLRLLTIQNFPVGFHSFSTAGGPQVALLEASYRYLVNSDETSAGSDAYSLEGSHRLRVFDTTTGREAWSREFPTSPSATHVNVTWIAGALAPSAGSATELLLRHVQVSRFGSDYVSDPLFTGKLASYGRRAAVSRVQGDAAQADPGRILWTTLTYDEDAARVNPPVEESFEELVWTHLLPVEDVTGDGLDDAVDLVLTREANDAHSENGRYRTHFVLLDAATGKRVWDHDVKAQGWGYLERISSSGDPHPQTALATTDLPSVVSSFRRFPYREVRIAVLDENGTSRWEYNRQHPIDSHAAYEAALTQFLHGIAPLDLDADGRRDPVTPAQHVAGDARNQSVLASSVHAYEVRSANDSEPLRRLEAPFPSGQIVDCGEPIDGKIHLLVGHARRLDLIQVDLEHQRRDWRAALYMNPARPSTVSGQSLVLASLLCERLPQGGVRYAGAVGLGGGPAPYTALLGEIGADGTARWQIPELPQVPAMEAALGALAALPPAPSLREDLASVGAPPLAAGAALGVLYGLRLRRARRDAP